jgi:hypothetical protein
MLISAQKLPRQLAQQIPSSTFQMLQVEPDIIVCLEAASQARLEQGIGMMLQIL